MFKKYIRRLKKRFHHAARSPIPAERLALSFAFAVFLSVLPTGGFAVVIGLAISLFWKYLHKVAMIAGFILMAPFFIPISILSITLGNMIIGSGTIGYVEISLFSSIFHATGKYVVGNSILAVTFSIIGYFVVYGLVMYYREHHKLHTKTVEKKK